MIFIQSRVLVFLVFISPLLINAADMTQSVVIQEQNAMIGICDALVKKSKEVNDDTKPTIFHLVTDKTINKQYWTGYIKYLFNTDLLTPQDIMWVVKEYAQNGVLLKADADQMFKQLIVDSLSNPNKKDRMVELLTRTALHKYVYLGDDNQKALGAESVQEFHSVLARTIEDGYSEPLKAMIIAWPPSVKDLWLLDACSRDERVDGADSSFMQGYKYAIKKYTLAQWILRSKGTNYHLYLDASKSGKKNYIDAVKIILAHVVRKNKFVVDGFLFSMAAVLERHNDLPAGVLFSTLVHKLESIENIVKEALSIPQKSQMATKFPAINN